MGNRGRCFKSKYIAEATVLVFGKPNKFCIKLRFQMWLSLSMLLKMGLNYL